MSLKSVILHDMENWYAEVRLWNRASVSEAPLEALRALPEDAGKEDVAALCDKFRDVDPAKDPEAWIFSAAANQLDFYC